jgi:16S rRNA (guanine527-N7)-methyltransferase
MAEHMALSSDIQSLEPVFIQGIQALGLNLNTQHISQCLRYLALLLHWNRVYNLTAIRSPHDALIRHVLDSLAIVPSLVQKSRGCVGIQILDVGSGGGLPGLILAIARPDWRITCIDTVAKKTAFIQHAAAQLGLQNVQIVHGRVESWQATSGPASFDWVISRAFSSLALLVSLTRFHVKQALVANAPPSGYWAMKGEIPHAELAALPLSIGHEVQSIQVPGLDAQRCLVWLEQAQAQVQAPSHSINSI